MMFLICFGLICMVAAAGTYIAALVDKKKEGR